MPLFGAKGCLLVRETMLAERRLRVEAEPRSLLLGCDRLFLGVLWAGRAASEARN